VLTSICPIVPSADFNKTSDFYKPLGFRVTALYEEEGYLILEREGVEVHFYRSESNDPATSACMAFVRVSDARELWEEFQKLSLPLEGIPRVTPAEDKPWGICELAVVDPDGNLLRIGHILE